MNFMTLRTSPSGPCVTAPVGVVMRRAAELEASRLHRTIHRCVYCGLRSYALIACRKHRDLVKLDPAFTPQYEAEPAEDVFPDVLPDRLQTQGA